VADAAAFAAILAAITLGAVSPGPSFVYVARAALSRGRGSASISALGMGIGGVVFALLALLGLSAILHYAEWAYIGLKVLGGVYLVVLAVRMWRGAGHAVVEAADLPRMPGWRILAASTLVQLSNPKAVVVYGSIFAALLPATPSLAMLLALPPAIFAIETGWYLVVAALFSTPAPRRVYARFSRGVDRTAAALLGGIGAVFAVDGVRSALR
jgi:threonine/homoserine/homoserine lactone efflux protein